MTVVRAFPRVHVGLIDMGGATMRDHGGAGFTLAAPPVQIRAQSGHFALNGLERLDSRAQGDVREMLSRVRADRGEPDVAISIEDVPEQHVGLGTKTALLLAILKAMDVASNGAPWPERRLQQLSGRGGVSGIGIHSFFHGGFIVDGGHAARKGRHYVPSSRQKGFSIPPIQSRVDIPDEWLFCLCCAAGRRYADEDEQAFFARACPVPVCEVLQSLALVYHGILPAVAEADLHKLRDALRELHSVGFKKRELENQPACVNLLYRRLAAEPRCAVGMSSMGPLIYAVVQQDDIRTSEAIRRAAGEAGSALLAVTRGRNRGFDLL